MVICCDNLRKRATLNEQNINYGQILVKLIKTNLAFVYSYL